MPDKRRTSRELEELLELIKTHYTTGGMSAREFVDTVCPDLSVWQIYNYASEYDLQKYPNWSESDERWLTKNHEDLSIPELGTELGKSGAAIRSKLKSLGIMDADRPDGRTQTRGGVDDEFFDHLTPSVAVVVGFFAADGSIFGDGALSITQHAPRDHLVAIVRDMVGIENPAHKIQRGGPVLGLELSWTSRRHVEALKRVWGVKQDKTLSLSIPDRLFMMGSEEILKAYLLGYFLGDGHTTRSGRHRSCLTLAFSSASPKVLEQIRDYADLRFPGARPNGRRADVVQAAGCLRWALNGSRAEAFYVWMTSAKVDRAWRFVSGKLRD